MADSISCLPDDVTRPFGSEPGYERELASEERCRDRGVAVGGTHHFGCCVAWCLPCGDGQYLFCDHFAVEAEAIRRRVSGPPAWLQGHSELQGDLPFLQYGTQEQAKERTRAPSRARQRVPNVPRMVIANEVERDDAPAGGRGRHRNTVRGSPRGTSHGRCAPPHVSEGADRNAERFRNAFVPDAVGFSTATRASASSERRHRSEPEAYSGARFRRSSARPTRDERLT
jgi:hypothetical protein